MTCFICQVTHIKTCEGCCGLCEDCPGAEFEEEANHYPRGWDEDDFCDAT